MAHVRIIENILKTMPTIAVVGFSSRPQKAGFYVPQYMQKHGYRIIPINPNIATGLEETAYPSLEDLPFEVDVVQIFRRSELVLPFIEAAINISAKAIWLQRDITHVDGRELAVNAGLAYVEDRCMMVEHRHLLQYGWSGLDNSAE